MTHPITPSPELIKDWHDEWDESDQIVHSAYTHIAIRAAQWGADQELEYWVDWISEHDWTWTSAQLRATRRPKPPSLKEQALEALERFSVHAHAYADEMMADFDLISRALEQLDD